MLWTQPWLNFQRSLQEIGKLIHNLGSNLDALFISLNNFISLFHKKAGKVTKKAIQIELKVQPPLEIKYLQDLRN